MEGIPPMNKMVKGSIAGATGVALLMGGFGTYALWSDSGNLDNAQVTSGVLDVAAGTASWADGAGSWNPGTDLMVPGDTVTRSQQFTFTATGKNMTGTIRFEDGTQNEQSTGSGDDFTVSVGVSGLTGVTGGSDGCYEFAAPLGSPLNVDTTVTFALTADAQDLQNVNASLAGAGFVIEQGDSC